MAQNNFFEKNKGLILAGGGLAILYFGIIRPIMIKIGLQKTAEEKRKEKEVEEVTILPDNANPFSPRYWSDFVAKNPKAKPIFYTVASAQLAAKQIHKALGYWTDEEATVLGVIRAAKNWIQISQIADQFEKLYHRDLWKYLDEGDAIWWWSGLGDAELIEVKNIAFSKPKF
jgi:hypothetical protein